ncbi:hypothetical protein BS11774_06795 [Bacillus subtilis]|nr:hypothetical protein CLD04_01315 [Bacillus subtilis]OTQ84461.1 hypothetical protein BG30_13715 [Bacillus subtilis subsp. subtilis]QAR60248.1 hypothetical protein BS11774_06795 [Bacillus subtilis]WGD90824.1 hypothetical protein P5665_04275 [Bacillus subtilis]
MASKTFMIISFLVKLCGTIINKILPYKESEKYKKTFYLENESTTKLTEEKVCGFFAVQTLFGNVRILHKKKQKGGIL